jgi:hypothetical protein
MTAKDIISRDTLKRLTTDLAKNLLGVDGEAIELLETQNQRVEDRRADLLARMRATSGEEFLLHVEIANNNQADFAISASARPNRSLATSSGASRNC